MVAIDLGSNTLRVVEMECSTKSFGATYEKMVKTADGLVDSGIISSDALSRVVDAISESKKSIDFSSSIRAVATEAMRRASNSRYILDQIYTQTGVKFEIISGSEEARLTLLAVDHRLGILSGNSSSYLLIDIGGGSTELIFNYQDKKISKSFPIGILTIAQSYHTLEDIDRALYLLMDDMIDFVDDIYSRYGRVDSFVATAGTPTTIAAMKIGQTYTTYDPKEINGMELNSIDLDDALSHILSLPSKKRELLVGVGRSDLVTAGILIFKRLFDISGMPKCIVVDDGLREGVALDSCLGLYTDGI